MSGGHWNARRLPSGVMCLPCPHRNIRGRRAGIFRPANFYPWGKGKTTKPTSHVVTARGELGSEKWETVQNGFPAYLRWETTKSDNHVTEPG